MLRARRCLIFFVQQHCSQKRSRLPQDVRIPMYIVGKYVISFRKDGSKTPELLSTHLLPNSKPSVVSLRATFSGSTTNPMSAVFSSKVYQLRSKWSNLEPRTPRGKSYQKIALGPKDDTREIHPWLACGVCVFFGYYQETMQLIHKCPSASLL